MADYIVSEEYCGQSSSSESDLVTSQKLNTTESGDDLDERSLQKSEDKSNLKRKSSYGLIPPRLSELRLVLLGNNGSLKASVGNLLLRKTEFTEHDKCVKGSRKIQDKELTVICSSDQQLNNISQQDLQQHIKDLSSSGPHVFLLVLQPEHFTEPQKRSLESVLESFSEQVFQRSLVLMFRPEAETPGSMEKYMREPHIRDMIIRCRYRYLWMDHTDLHQNDLKEFKHKQLFSRICDMLKENNADDLSSDPSKKPSLNLVLFGRSGAETISAAKCILGRSELPAASPGQCVKHEGEVSGRCVSLVELPPLSGKPLETVKQLCLDCISLCAPEGVHAFILVLPGPLTDEDKEELEILQKTLSARVRGFTVGLISVESDAAVDSRKSVNLVELGQICGGGALCLNIRDPQEVTELMDTVDKLTQGGAKVYTKDMNFSLTGLRIALIGKSSSGKSDVANTILGEKCFQSKAVRKQANIKCETVSRMVHSRTVTMTITPPLFNDSFSEEQLSRCVSQLSPGPHVFLLLLPIGNIDKPDRDSLQLIKNRLGEKVAEYVIIVFTRGEELDVDYTIENYIEEHGDIVKDMLKQCNNRYHVLNNKNETNHTQVAELLEKIDKMAQENSCFTQEMFKMKDVQDQLKEAQKKIQVKENIEIQLEQLKEKTSWLIIFLFAIMFLQLSIYIKIVLS